VDRVPRGRDNLYTRHLKAGERGLGSCLTADRWLKRFLLAMFIILIALLLGSGFASARDLQALRRCGGVQSAEALLSFRAACRGAGAAGFLSGFLIAVIARMGYKAEGLPQSTRAKPASNGANGRMCGCCCGGAFLVRMLVLVWAPSGRNKWPVLSAPWLCWVPAGTNHQVGWSGAARGHTAVPRAVPR
jgi:hypothetical protein